MSKSLDYERTTLFLGAGSSLVGESGLPLFGQMRSAFVTNLLEVIGPTDDAKGREGRVDALTAAMAPEALLGALDDAGVDVDSAIVQWFNDAAPQPNGIHRLAAAFLERGARVWTPNYDTMIEESLQQGKDVKVVSFPRLPTREGLAKPHGSLPDRVDGKWPHPSTWRNGHRLAFAARDLIRELPSEWRDRLLIDLSDRDVHIVGYAGQDVDLFLPLHEGLMAARSVHWYTTEDEDKLHRPEFQRILQRFSFLELDSLRRELGDGRVVLIDPNPSALFASMARKSDDSLPRISPDSLRVSRRTLSHIPLGDIATIARADLMAELGLGADATRIYRRVLLGLSSGLPARSRAAAALLRRNVRRLRRRRVLVAIGRVWAKGPSNAPGVQTARRLAAEDLHTRDSWPDVEDLQKWFLEADSRRVFGIGLGLVRALRYRGRLKEASAKASELLARARSGSSPAHIATFSFQLTECFRMRGLHRAAIKHMNLRLTTLAAKALVYWDEFERIACRLQQLDGSEDIGLALAELERELDSVGESFGGDTVELARAVWLRLRGDHQAALMTLHDLRVKVAPRSPLLTETVDSHLIEVHRLMGDNRAAREVLDAIRGDWFVNDGIGLLQRFLIEPEDAEPLLKAFAIFERKGYELGMAVAVMLDHFHGPGLLREYVARAQQFLAENRIPLPTDLRVWSLVIL